MATTARSLPYPPDLGDDDQAGPRELSLTAHPLPEDEPDFPWEVALRQAAGWAWRAETAANYVHDDLTGKDRRDIGTLAERQRAENVRDNAVAMATMWAGIANVAAGQVDIAMDNPDTA